MKTVILYMLICGGTPYELNVQADQLCAQGYKPVGGVAMALTGPQGYTVEMTYCQAFTKESRSNK